MASPLRQLSACARRLSQWSLNELYSSYPGLRDAFDHLDFEFRERVFSPVVTFWMFLSQVLSDGASCQEMVAKVLAALWLTITVLLIVVAAVASILGLRLDRERRAVSAMAEASRRTGRPPRAAVA